MYINTVNIYLTTRSNNSEDIYKCLCHGLGSIIEYRDYELLSLKQFVDSLMENTKEDSIALLDGFYFSYTIPQLSKEFDLLKIGADSCINIELKSQYVPEKRIKKQLLHNRHYLSGVLEKVELYTFVADKKRLYHLDGDDLVISSYSELICDLLLMADRTYSKDVDELFDPTLFLVSPLNSPKAFLDNRYFLTESQESFKEDILKRISFNNNQVFGIYGKPGTGKTLLLYDIGKTIAKTKNVLMIHCGKTSGGHYVIGKNISSLKIISAKEINTINIEDYDVVMIDEFQRLFQEQFSLILETTNKNKSPLICAYDPKQILSNKEKNADVSSLLESIDGFKKYHLTTKIRTNEEIANFIKGVINLNKDIVVNSPNAEVLFANDFQEAKRIIDLYESLGYVFINMTPSSHVDSVYNQWETVTSRNTHKVIGQEFDRVIVTLDDFFRYNNGVLESKPHPNPNYLFSKLFYQNITRARKQLTILVVNNRSLYSQMLKVFGI